MNIHILTASLKTNSGYANIARYLAKGLTKLGHSVTFTGLQTTYTPEFSYGFEILPVDTKYIIDKYQYLLNLQNTKADLAINIYQSDLPDMNEFAKSFKNTIFYTTLEGERIPTFSANDFVSILKQGGMVVFPTKFARNEMEKVGIKNIPVISYGYNDSIFKPLDLKNKYKDSTKYCYYRTEVGKCMSDPLFLHKTGCYDCHYDCISNTACQCPHFKEEEICILKWSNNENNEKTWIQNNIPISKLKEQFKGKFVFLGVGHNNGVRKRWERMLKSYSIFINNRQHKDRTHLHIHTVPMSVEGINLLEEIALLGIENNVSFTYSRFGPSGFTEQAMNILYNCADVYVSSSSGEGYNVPLIESMAAGLPSIATNFTSFPELIGEEITIDGHICPRGLLVKCIPQMTQTTSFKGLIDEEDMSNKMKIMFQDKELRDNCSKNALKFAKTLTWDKIIPMWDSLLKEMTTKKL